MLDKKAYNIAINKIKYELEDKIDEPLDETYDKIYSDLTEEYKFIFMFLHYKLNALIVFLNYKARNIYIDKTANEEKTFVHFNAAESRQMIYLIGIIDKINQVSKGHAIIEINSRYEKFIEFINPQLQDSGGSPIYNFNEPFKIIEYEPIFTLKKHTNHGSIKNIIFASLKKPEIILENALENNIKIVKNEEYSLVFDQSIKGSHLTVKELIEWWNEKSDKKLFSRLLESIDGNDVEKILFNTYYKDIVKDDFSFPALLPQVYLHYDPKTIKELYGEKRLIHQRMDFLMLYRGKRIIIEIDGIHHYSEDGKASPKKYAEMVSYDRQMKLYGYEIYRFGGFEFKDASIKKTIVDFFRILIEKDLKENDL